MPVDLLPGTPASATAAFAVPLRTDYVDGDYTLIVGTNNSSTGGITTASTGYTEIITADSVNGSTSAHVGIYVKKWAAGDTDPTFDTSGRSGGVAIRVTGAHAATFLDVTAAVTQAASGATAVDAPSVTPFTLGAQLVTVHVGRRSTNGLPPTWTAPTGMTEVVEAGGNVAASTNSSLVVTTLSGLTAGTPTGVRTATASLSTTGAFGVSFAIKEAATAPAQGAAAGSWSFTGTAAGSTDRAGTASGSWAFTGAASGQATRTGTAAGTWSFASAASGTAPAIAANTGTATGAWSFTGAATGSTSRSGTASGAWSFSGAATGAAPSTTPPTHSYGRSTITPSVGTAVLAGNGTSTAAVTGGTVGGFGFDFGLSFAVPTVTGPVTATITPTAPGTAELQLD